MAYGKYTIYIRGMGLKGIKVIGNGWQQYKSYTNKGDAEALFQLLKRAYGDDVVLTPPYETTKELYRV